MEQSRIALRRQLMTTKHCKSLHCTDDVTKELFRLFNKMNVVARVVDLALGFKVGVRCQLGALGSHLFQQLFELGYPMRVVRQPELMTSAI